MPQMNTPGKVVIPLVVIALFVAIGSGCGGGSSRPGAPQAVAPVQRVGPSDVVHPTATYCLGDLDGDGLASVGDGIKILRIVVGLDSANDRADANQSGTTDVGDAIAVLRCVVGLDTWPIATGVDATGGTVVAADGDVELDFPPGAVSQDFLPEVEPTSTYPADPDIVPGAVYEFGPPGTSFAQPVGITIAYDPPNIPAGAQEDDLRLCKVEDGVWEAVAGSTVDTATDTVTGEADSFSIYGVGAKLWQAYYVFERVIGQFGYDPGEFVEPRGIALDRDGNVYVVDMGHTNFARVQKFTNMGAFVTSFGSFGDGVGQFKAPIGICIDAAVGHVLVADKDNSRIQSFTKSGLSGSSWGTRGSDEGEFLWPQGVAADGQGYSYVADTANHRIQKFTGDGTFVKQWGSMGDDPGQLYHPSDVAVDGSGNVYVVGAGRVDKFTSDGVFQTRWDSQCLMRAGVGVDNEGNVYVSDQGNHRVHKFSPAGSLLARWGTQGRENGQFWYPMDVAVDAQGYVYVMDSDNHRVQVFRPQL